MAWGLVGCTRVPEGLVLYDVRWHGDWLGAQEFLRDLYYMTYDGMGTGWLHKGS